MTTNSQLPIRIAQVFLARAMFEHTAKAVELPPTTPVGEIGANVQVAVGLNDEETAGVISVSVTSSPESTGVYRYAIEMIALVERTAVEGPMTLREYVTSAGPPMLYPFLREAIANLSSRGRFGPIWLQPMNFTEILEKLQATSWSSEAKAET